METYCTPREVIAALGGPTEVARRLGVGRQAVTNWTLGDHFPPKTYRALRALLKEKHASAPDSLWPMLDLPPKKARQHPEEASA